MACFFFLRLFHFLSMQGKNICKGSAPCLYLVSASCLERSCWCCSMAASRPSRAAFSRPSSSFSLHTWASACPWPDDSGCSCSRALLDDSCSWETWKRDKVQLEPFLGSPVQSQPVPPHRQPEDKELLCSGLKVSQHLPSAALIPWAAKSLWHCYLGSAVSGPAGLPGTRLLLPDKHPYTKFHIVTQKYRIFHNCQYTSF